VNQPLDIIHNRAVLQVDGRFIVRCQSCGTRTSRNPTMAEAYNEARIARWTSLPGPTAATLICRHCYDTYRSHLDTDRRRHHNPAR
jgi:hypothetical protein